MAGIKDRSGGRRLGAGGKKKAELVMLHTLIDSHVANDDWAAIVAALVERAKQGDVQAFRELRACRFGQIPMAAEHLPGELFAINQALHQDPLSSLSDRQLMQTLSRLRPNDYQPEESDQNPELVPAACASGPNWQPEVR